MQTSSYGLTLV